MRKAGSRVVPERDRQMMKRLIVLLGSVGLVTCAGSCGDLKIDSPEAVMQDMAALLSQSGEDLGRVQDEKGAQDVRPKLQNSWERWQALKGRLAAAREAQIRPPSTQVTKTAESQLNVSRKLFLTQWRRINNPKKRPWGPPLLEEFEDFVVSVSGIPAEPPREFLPPTLDALPPIDGGDRKPGVR